MPCWSPRHEAHCWNLVRTWLPKQSIDAEPLGVATVQTFPSDCTFRNLQTICVNELHGAFLPLKLRKHSARLPLQAAYSGYCQRRRTIGWAFLFLFCQGKKLDWSLWKQVRWLDILSMLESVSNLFDDVDIADMKTSLMSVLEWCFEFHQDVKQQKPNQCQTISVWMLWFDHHLGGRDSWVGVIVAHGPMPYFTLSHSHIAWHYHRFTVTNIFHVSNKPLNVFF